MWVAEACPVPVLLSSHRTSTKELRRRRRRSIDFLSRARVHMLCKKITLLFSVACIYIYIMWWCVKIKFLFDLLVVLLLPSFLFVIHPSFILPTIFFVAYSAFSRASRFFFAFLCRSHESTNPGVGWCCSSVGRGGGCDSEKVGPGR